MHLNKKGHTTVVGMTRFGKSFFTKKQLINQPKGAIYFNTKRETSDLDNFFNIDASVDFDNLVDKLNKGYKFNFIVSKDFERAEFELDALINLLIDNTTINQSNSIYFAVDEIQLFNTLGQRALKKLATIGISSGINGVFLSQRLKNIPNDIMTQSSQNIFFYTRFEKNYYKQYGLDADRIAREIDGKKYNYVLINPENHKLVKA